MSQEIFDSIDPAISGTALAGVLDDFKNALMTGLSGTSRPDELDLGGGWIDTTNDPTTWSYRIWTGTADVEVFKIHLSTGLASVALAVEEFAVKKITADTAGALFKLVKRRIANNGQVLSGDTIGEIQFVGRGDDASNPVVAKMVWVASDDQTTSAYGGEFAFHSTADGSATLVKHMRFVDGVMETLVPLKVNSLRLGSQSVATAASINQLDADFSLVEMTGSTATDLRGIDSAGNARVLTVHNRSSANVTIKHENSSATDVDRFKLPGGLDYIIIPDASATFYYCDTDERWKLKSTAEKNFFGFTVETFYGVRNTWVAPSSTTAVRVRAYKRYSGMNFEMSMFVDPYGNAYAWGINANGQLGAGNVTPTSSPVAVLGGFTFGRTFGSTNSTGACRFGIDSKGDLYGWGVNTSSQLGLGANITPRSSPVIVVGGLKWNWVWPQENSTFGLTTGNQLFAWGVNTNGQLGVGNVTLRSSPVAVLGGLQFSKAVPLSAANNSASVVGLTLDGLAYAWGMNSNGQLGVGDVTPRSSPVAVVGGITFNDVGGGGLSNNTFYAGLDTSGNVYAWGANGRGQLGVGDSTPRSSPVAVVGGLTFKRIFTQEKSESIFGLTSNGTLYGWGENDQGQLGIGNTDAQSSPVAVLGGLTFKSVRLYKKSVFGITNDGTVYAWGLNANGQLALGDVVSRSSPVAILGGLKFFDVRVADGANDNYSIFGLVVDGTLYAWGRNTNGTLGVGDVTPRSSPVVVLTGARADTQESSFSGFLTVTPSASYAVNITNGISSFGNTSLGAGIYKVEIEYLQ